MAKAKSKPNENLVQNPFANRFLLSVAVAKRARQLKEGAKPRVETQDDFQEVPVVVALEEIRQHKVNVVMRSQREMDDEMMEEIADFLDEDNAAPAEGEAPAKSKKESSKSRSVAA